MVCRMFGDTALLQKSGPLGTNCNEIWIEIQKVSLNNAFEIFVSKLMAIVLRSRCVNPVRVTHKCVSELIIIAHQAKKTLSEPVLILLIEPMGTNLSEIWIKVYTFSFKKMHLKMPSAKTTAILSRPQCVKQLSCRPGCIFPACCNIESPELIFNANLAKFPLPI